MTTTLTTRKLNPVTIGPGYGFSVSTNMPGGPPAGSIWAVTLSDPVNVVQVFTRFDFPTAGPGPTSFTWDVPGQGTLIQGDRSAIDITLCTMSVQLVRADSTIVVGEATALNNVNYDGTQLLGDVVHQVAVTAGGFTESDRTTAQTTLSSVSTATTLIDGSQLLLTVDQLVQHPAAGFIGIAPGEQLLTGRGTLAMPPAGLAAFPTGALIDFLQIPRGFGFLDGYVRVYFNRLLQIGTRHHSYVFGPLYITERLEVTADLSTWLFAERVPAEIFYDVTVGCIARLRWLV